MLSLITSSIQKYRKGVLISHKGMTLIEVIVTMAIVSMLVSLIISIGDCYNRIYKREMTHLENESTVRVLQMELEESIKEASYATCCFDNLKLGKIGISSSQKRLLYVEPLKDGSNPYLLVLKYAAENKAILQKIYVSSSKTIIDEWRTQGVTLIKDTNFCFDSISADENIELNNQMYNLLFNSMTCDNYSMIDESKLPDEALLKINADSYYYNNKEDEYMALYRDGGVASIIYIDHIQKKKNGNMIKKSTSTVMDGIQDLVISQRGDKAFFIQIFCRGKCYKSTAVMREYIRGGSND